MVELTHQKLSFLPKFQSTTSTVCTTPSRPTMNSNVWSLMPARFASASGREPWRCAGTACNAKPSVGPRGRRAGPARNRRPRPPRFGPLWSGQVEPQVHAPKTCGSNCRSSPAGILLRLNERRDFFSSVAFFLGFHGSGTPMIAADHAGAMTSGTGCDASGPGGGSSGRGLFAARRNSSSSRRARFSWSCVRVSKPAWRA